MAYRNGSEAAAELLRHSTSPLIAKHVKASTVDFTRLFEPSHFAALSSGEQTLVKVALDLYNGAGSATVSDILRLDKTNRRLALAIITEYSEEVL